MTDSIVLSLMAIGASCAKSRLIQKTRQVMATQERFLCELLQLHQHTELGQSLKLAEIKTIDQFRAQIPVLPYSHYEPYVERIASGESKVLNPEPVIYISLTSGTTGSKKQVPVTRQFQRSLGNANSASLGFLIDRLKQRNTSFGKSLITNSVKLQGQTIGGIDYGPVSVGSLRQGRRLLNYLFTSPFTALEIEDTLARHYISLLFALRYSHLKGWVANFPMLILRTCRYLEHYAEPLIEDLSAGTIAPWLNLNSNIRQRLEQRWFALPDRAEQLQSILRQDGKLSPQSVWADLSYIITARGGTSDFYFKRFPDYFGETPVYGGVLGTAEGTFGIYPDFNTDGAILAIESGFFEFIPEDQWEVEHPKTLLSSEVKVGEWYRILVTSYSGFYRYDIGDVVEVTGFYEQTPLIAFRYRRGGLLSSTTEKTTEFHVVQVMQTLQAKFNTKFEDFCITLSDNEFPSRYLVNIELAPGYTLSQPQALLAKFEEELKRVNSPYGTVRQDQVPPPRLRILAPGSFAVVRQQQVQRGMFDSQLKLPHISEDRTLLAGITVEQEIDLPIDITTLARWSF